MLEGGRSGAPTFPGVGWTADPAARPPAGYAVDRYEVRLGSGPDDLARAGRALRAWRMIDLGWVALCWPETPPVEGAVVAPLVRALGAWHLNPVRVVHAEEAADRIAFAWATLPGHAERGEERFEVALEDGAVVYRILAVSRPGTRLTRLGRPVVRRLQRRFGRDSLAAMVRAMEVETASPGE